jgi:hypothetical protein
VGVLWGCCVVFSGTQDSMKMTCVRDFFPLQYYGVASSGTRKMTHPTWRIFYLSLK